MKRSSETDSTTGIRTRSRPELGLDHGQSEMDGARPGRRRCLAEEARVVQ